MLTAARAVQGKRAEVENSLEPLRRRLDAHDV
eukprot:CAMPEP_0206045512 /NCGR_PEP_ID=MMETSP1466-20131121/16126_1 /ASSEMBLY_ACC=CAM_ASM_001126 /TAXON_ID=44452 /ORGANISM="Pavlova gyrans, Strain CCMP608" /LENGTH=31 /DNA_ID= /DNA_START= /DNA_END= /DNA_ORIENTATION=